jgi:DNA polymerase-3 subunit delta'
MPFKDVLGHDRELLPLRKGVLAGTVAHAYLFSGPEGVGKKTAAIAFASALNCASFGASGPSAGHADDRSADACGVCADCVAIAASVHANVALVAPEDGVIRIDAVRGIQNRLKYRVDRGFKVAIVDGAERMMPGAANAFLKTLEEPPPRSVIILVSYSAFDLMPTVVSRCRRVNFRPLPEVVIRGYLSGRAGLSSSAAEEAARLSGGSITSAAAYADSGASERRKAVIERVKGLREGDIAGAMGMAEALSKDDGLEEALGFMKEWYRDSLVRLEGATGPVSAARAGEDPEALFDRLRGSFELVERARRDMAPPRYANKRLALEAMFLGIVGSAPRP